MIKRPDLIKQNNDIKKVEDEEINIESKEYNDLIRIYEIAMNQVASEINLVKEKINKLYGYSIIDKITARVKSKKSIINKMKKKNIKYTYTSLIDNISDIAGVRITCPVQEDIFFVKQIIEMIPNLKIIKEKDYINNPKKSGYSAYHLIVETPVTINGETVVMKVEIQIRTIAMDFWAEMEHDIRYKPQKSISLFDSKKLTWYAKILEKLQGKIVKIYRKQETNNLFYNY